MAQQSPVVNGPAISARAWVYTAGQTSNTVTVINLATNAVVGQILLGNPRPKALEALDDTQVNVPDLGFPPDRHDLNTASNTSNGVTIIRTCDNHVMGTVHIGRGPHEGFFTLDRREVWLNHKDVGKVSVSDARTFNVLHVLDTGNVMNHVNDVSLAGGHFICVTVGREDVDEVIKRGSQPQIVATILMDFKPPDLWPRGDNTRVYVGLEDQDTVDVIDTASNTVVKTISLGQMPLVRQCRTQRNGHPEPEDRAGGPRSSWACQTSPSRSFQQPSTGCPATW